MGVSERAPEAAVGLLLRRSGQPQDMPPWPGRHRCGLRAGGFFPCASSSPLCGAATQRDPPPRNGFYRKMNRDAAHGFERKERLS